MRGPETGEKGVAGVEFRFDFLDGECDFYGFERERPKLGSGEIESAKAGPFRRALDDVGMYFHGDGLGGKPGDFSPGGLRVSRAG